MKKKIISRKLAIALVTMMIKYIYMYGLNVNSRFIMPEAIGSGISSVFNIKVCGQFVS